MYRTVDSLPIWKATLYFSTMIFFLAWLVKNVFIAVITETFNEIRVQFQQMWGVRSHMQSNTTSEVFSSDGKTWRLVTRDENKISGLATKSCQVILHSPSFRLLVMGQLLL